MKNKNISKKIKTLCFILRDNQILLGMKKRGFAVGKWNGFGGKVEDGKSIKDAVKRELLEEANITVINPYHCGIITFQGNDLWDVVEVHVFRCEKYNGTPEESEEMRPKWFNQNDVPYEQMLPDLKYWLPLVFKGQKFKAEFIFNKKIKIIDYKIIKLPNNHKFQEHNGKLFRN